MDLTAAKQKLTDKLAVTESGTFLIEGATLIGKTHLLEYAQSNLKADAEALVVSITCSQSHAGYEPVLDSIEKLSRRENWSPAKRAGRIAKLTGVHIGTGIAGVFRRFFPDAIPKETLDAVRNGLDDVIKANNQGAPALDFPRSEKSKIAKMLSDVIEKSGRRLILFVDRLDELPTPGIQLLQFITETGPDKVTLVLAANSESAAYYERQDIRELTNTCKTRGGHFVWTLEGYSPDVLRNMRQSNGYQTSLDEARDAFEFSLSGRIGLVHTWLTSAENNVAQLKPHADQLAAHYAIQYERLGEKSKTLVKCLAAAYPHGLPFQLVSLCLDCSVSELDNRIRNVQAFVDVSNDTVTLKNKHILYFFTNSMPGAAAIAKACYEELGRKLSDGTAEKPLLPNTQALILPMSLPHMDRQTVVSTAQDYLARGASQAAIAQLDAWRAWKKSSAKEDIELHAETLLLEADAYGQLGAYQRAIDLLKTIPPVTSLNIETSISLGEKLYRIGAHDDALKYFSHARRESRRVGRCTDWLRATARTLSVKNELGCAASSRRLANCLASQMAHAEAADSRTNSLAYRALARTWALSPARTGDAYDAARKALEIAHTQTMSKRDEGNARYAIADVLRHQGKIAEALEEYDIAYRLGSETKNYDLKLYAMLGKAAIHISLASVDELLRILAVLEDLPVKPDSPEKVILELFQQTANKLKNADVIICDNYFGVQGRPWTKQLTRLLEKNDGRILENHLRDLVIVL